MLLIDAMGGWHKKRVLYTYFSRSENTFLYAQKQAEINEFFVTNYITVIHVKVLYQTIDRE